MNVGLVVGEAGTGKTHWLNRLIQAHRHPRRRFWIYAPWGGFRGVPVRSVSELRRLPTLPPVVVVTGGDPVQLLEAALDVGSVTVVIDEVQSLAPATIKRWPRGHPLWQVLFEGRHSRVMLWGATQFPLNVSASLRDAAFWVVAFRLCDPYQLQYLSRRCSAAVARDVAQLTGHEHIVWTPTNGDS